MVDIPGHLLVLVEAHLVLRGEPGTGQFKAHLDQSGAPVAAGTRLLAHKSWPGCALDGGQVVLLIVDLEGGATYALGGHRLPGERRSQAAGAVELYGLVLIHIHIATVREANYFRRTRLDQQRLGILQLGATDLNGTSS